MEMSKAKQKKLTSYQRSMRRSPTKAERQFKFEVMNVLKERYSINYVSQKIIWEVVGRKDSKAYIIDFYLPDIKMAIEIDGSSHKGKQAQTYDAIRDSLCAKRGIRVIRFTNEEVKDPTDCLRRLYKEIEEWQHKLKAKPTANLLSRNDELLMQQEYIMTNGVKKLPTIGKDRKPLK